MFTRYFDNRPKIFLLLPLILLLGARAVFAQGTAFTFQGKLGDNGSPVNGSFDMQFELFDAADPNKSTQVGTTITLNNPLVQVTNGVFTVQLDFGEAALPGADRFLEIRIRRNSTDPYTLLSPRSKITSSPYAIRSLNATNATNADGMSTNCVGCIQSSHINSVDASKLTGTLPASAISASSLPAGSGNYIQNSTSLQKPSNFNISGDGTAGGRLSGNIVSATTQYNIGGNRVIANTGIENLFVGAGAGSANTGSENSFVGANAGNTNTSGSLNSFFGSNAGKNNTTEQGNTFAGYFAGVNNGLGDTSNTGNSNTFLGAFTGLTNRNGGSNTAVGSGADLSTSNLVNATAVGANALVGQSNSLVLGSINGVNNATADTKVGIGTTTPSQRLHVVGNGLFTGNLSVGLNGSVSGALYAGTLNTPTLRVAGTGVVRARIDSNDNAGLALTLNNQPKWSVATTLGLGRFVIFNDSAGENALEIIPTSDGTHHEFHINGRLILGGFFPTGTEPICRGFDGTISTCGSSIRYKNNINNFSSGLTLITRLRPVTFNWKANNAADLGLIAEEVARVEPLLVTHNDKGEIEGVKYDRVAVVLVNAVKEQQAQIEQQQKLIETQQQQINALKKLVCATNRDAELCKN